MARNQDVVQGIQAFRKGRLCYLAVPKNALCSYVKFFTDHKWQRVNIYDLPNISTRNITFFGHIRHPLMRYTKGLTEALLGTDTLEKFLPAMEKDPTFMKFIMTSTIDDHTSSIANMVPPEIDPYRIKWIPMDHHKFDVDTLTNHAFWEYGLDYVISRKDRTNISDKRKLEVQSLIKKQIFTGETGKDRFNHQAWIDVFYKNHLLRDAELYWNACNHYDDRDKYYDFILGNR